MSISKEDMKEIIEECDKHYRTKEDCDDISGNLEVKQYDTEKQIAVICYQQKINNWLTTAIAGGIIALLIKVFIGG